MNDEIKTETQPRLFKLGRVLMVDTLIADPSITIIEIGETMGFLLSESCYEDQTGTFSLENVKWCRYIVQKKEITIYRIFNKVELYLHSSGKFVAQDHLSKNYLPYPSLEPYWIVFIDRERYFDIQTVIEQKALNKLSELVIHNIKGLPGFSFKINAVVAPPGYATATGNDLEHNMITV